MATICIPLVDSTRSIRPGTMMSAAAAFSLQIARDLSQFWSVDAIVIYDGQDHPVDGRTWPLRIVRHIPSGESGFHLSNDGHPSAKVAAALGSDSWTLTASHEIIEMLVDPTGDRTFLSSEIEIYDGAVRDAPRTVKYLVEACDPCQARSCAYAIDGIQVSDFITPDFYADHFEQGKRYSFHGSITMPRQVFPGGYVSWIGANDDVKQLLFLNPLVPPKIRSLGKYPGTNLRKFIDAKTGQA